MRRVLHLLAYAGIAACAVYRLMRGRGGWEIELKDLIA